MPFSTTERALPALYARMFTSPVETTLAPPVTPAETDCRKSLLPI